MAQAVVDPAELRRFATNLKRFTEDLEGQVSQISSQLQHLGSTWRDQEHIKFQEAFSDTLQAIKRFVKVAQEHAPYLLRKAERVEDYLQQR
jgi:WXG100 family type VII secretion target